jgi:hypothetical protein
MVSKSHENVFKNKNSFKWSKFALCYLKSAFAWELVQWIKWFCYLWKHVWRSSLVILLRTCWKFCWIFFLWPSISYLKTIKVTGSKALRVRGQQTSAVLFVAISCGHGGVSGYIVMMSQSVSISYMMFIHGHKTFCAVLLIYSFGWREEGILMMWNPLRLKKQLYACNIWSNLSGHFWSWWLQRFPLWQLLFCSQIIPISQVSLLVIILTRSVDHFELLFIR